MAFPTIPTVGAGRVLSALATSPSGTHTSPNLSSLTKNAGDLLIAIVIIYDGNSTNAEFSSWGGGFTEFGDFATTTTMGIGMAYKWSDGTETGTFTVTSADTSTNDSCFFLISIPGAHLSTPPEAGSYATGTAAAADPASFNPAGWGTEDTLWIAVGGSGEVSTTGSYTGVASAPANYSNYVDSGISADAAGGVEGALAFRQLNAASEDVGTFSVDTSNARNAAAVIAVRPLQIFTITPAGSITPSGALANAVGKPLGGAITPTGALINAVGKILGGSVTPTGTLTTTLVKTLALAGSITPSGALTNQVGKLLGGSITPSGAVRWDVTKFLAGAITPVGTLNLAAARQLLLAGLIVPAGSLVKDVSKSLSGEVAPSGTLQKQYEKPLSGSVTPDGTLTRQTGKALSGEIAPSGTLVKAVSKFLDGGIVPTGALSTFFSPGGGGAQFIALAGSIAPSGELIKAVSKNLSGTIAPDGALTKAVSLFVGGGVTPSGAVKKDVAKFVAGAIAPSGLLALLPTFPGAGVIGSVWGSVRQRFGVSGSSRGDQAAGGSRADGYASGGDRRSDP